MHLADTQQALLFSLTTAALYTFNTEVAGDLEKAIPDQ